MGNSEVKRKSKSTSAVEIPEVFKSLSYQQVRGRNAPRQLLLHRAVFKSMALLGMKEKSSTQLLMRGLG